MNELYTDGSSSRKSGMGGWAVVGHIGDRQIQICGNGKYSNQKAELLAIMFAIMCVEPGESLRIISDSQFSIKGCTEWRKTWESNGFLNYKNDPVSHQDIFKKIYGLLDQRTVEFVHVRGHRGDEGNEWADSIATQARALAEGSPATVEVFESYVLGLYLEKTQSLKSALDSMSRDQK